ncbi:MAG: enolase C-terminal domain-like protein [Acidimicrobiales bacterium]
MILTERRLRVPLLVELGGSWSRAVVLVHGPAGWGEMSPLPGYPCEPGRARAAAEESACRPWPAAVRTSVPVNVLVPALPPDEAAALAAGHRWVKVKVGDPAGVGRDVDRVAAVRSALGPGPAVRVDANGAWDLDTAVDAISHLSRYDIELVEQPVATIEDLAAVRRKVSVPVAADECVRDLGDARRLRDLAAADAVVLKVQPLGGVRAALEVAEAAGVAAIVTSMYETSVGLAAGLALAAALPELPYACGLGTANLLAADVVPDPLLAVDDQLEVRRPEPSPLLLDRLDSGLEGEGLG